MTDHDQAAGPVGVVGIGAMGMPIARRLRTAGMAVRAVDAYPPQVENARREGLAADTDPGSLRGCGVTLVLVATGAQVIDLLSGSPFADGGMAGSALVLMSTVGPQVATEAERLAQAAGVDLIDAPVTGGVVGARQGSLTLFAAGESGTIEALAPVLSPLGQVRTVGERIGDGQSFKLVNQLLAAVHLAAAAEALAFAERLGLDLATVMDVLPQGTAASWMLQDRGPRMATPSSDRPVQTHLDIFVKDSGLVAAAAREAGYRAPLVEATHRLFRTAADRGWGSADDSSVIDVFRDRD